MFHGIQNKTSSPFAYSGNGGNKAFVAIKGIRKGYIQLATSDVLETYGELPLALFEAAKAWAETLELHGASRVYWITLSEVVTHLHIHLYPRWEEDLFKGVALFEERENLPQPAWGESLELALWEWAEQYNVYIKTI